MNDDELERELAEDALLDSEVPTIADLTTDDVETMWADPIKRSVVLAQLLGGVLASLHPLRKGEITVMDNEIREALTKQITIDRFNPEGNAEGFFHVKLKG